MGVIVAIVVVLALALVSATTRAVAAIPWYLWAVAALVTAAGIGGLVALAVRVYRRDTAVFAARVEDRRALPAAAQRISTPHAPRQALPPVEQHIHDKW